VQFEPVHSLIRVSAGALTCGAWVKRVCQLYHAHRSKLHVSVPRDNQRVLQSNMQR
jgi:hypothetical protein